jgi:hypothetical protein
MCCSGPVIRTQEEPIMSPRRYCLRCCAVAILLSAILPAMRDCAQVDAADGATPDKPEAEALPAVGSAAPEIEGTDIDEVPFKLSDYRGHVIVLDFWGDW